MVETVDNPALQEQLNQANQTIISLQQQLTSANNANLNQNDSNLSSPVESAFEEVKRDLYQQFSTIFANELDREITQKFQQSTNYQQLANAQQQAFKQIQKSSLAKATIKSQSKTSLNKIPNERIILISLLVVSLLAIGGLLVKLKGSKRRKN